MLCATVGSRFVHEPLLGAKEKMTDFVTEISRVSEGKYVVVGNVADVVDLIEFVPDNLDCGSEDFVCGGLCHKDTSK